MVRMKIQIPKTRWIAGYRVTEYEIGEVTGADLYDAWAKALEAGHDPQKTVMWRVVGE